MNRVQGTDDYGVRLQYSGKGQFDFETYSIYANLEGTEIDVESSFVLAFNMDGIEIIFYANAADYGLSIKDLTGLYRSIFGISVINAQSGVMTPIWSLNETQQQRIFRYIDDFQELSKKLFNLSAINSELMIGDLVDLVDENKMLYEIASLLDKHGLKPSFLTVDD